MKKPILKLSLALKALWAAATTVMIGLVLLGFLVDGGKVTLGDMLWLAVIVVGGLVASYLAVEFIGVARGYIEDDVGAPPQSGGTRLSTLVAHLRFVKHSEPL